MSSNVDDVDTNDKNAASEGKNLNRNNSKESTKIANLRVAEVAEQRDVGRKIARIDPSIAERLNVSSGDALELSSLNKKSTVLSWPSREGDRKGVASMYHNLGQLPIHLRYLLTAFTKFSSVT